MSASQKDFYKLFHNKSRLALSQIPKKMNQRQVHTLREFDSQRKSFLKSFQFDKANEAKEGKKKFLTTIRVQQKSGEESRQSEEVEKFNIVFQKRKNKAITEINKSEQKTIKKWDRRKREMNLLHLRERTDYRNRYFGSSPKIRYSRRILDLIEKEEALIKCHLYEKVESLRIYRQKLEEKEKNAIINKFKKKYRLEYKRLLERQKWDRSNLQRKKKSGLLVFERKKKEKLDLLKKQKRNLLFDMKRAHKLEFRDTRIQKNRRVIHRRRVSRNISSVVPSRPMTSTGFSSINNNNSSFSRNERNRPQSARLSTRSNHVHFSDFSHRRPSSATVDFRKNEKTPYPSDFQPISAMKKPIEENGRKIIKSRSRRKKKKKKKKKPEKRRCSSSSYFGSILYNKEIARGKRIVIPSLVDLYLAKEREMS